ncbi:MAG: PIN domain nuclease [Acidobacteria bacterium]|nr:MAG: PIN domain nuclease [Acidobacteriota bacterium]
MSYLIDTNVLVRLAQPRNPDQRESRRALRVLRRRPDFLGIIPQNLIEFWAVATRPASSNGLDLTVDEAARYIGKLKALFTLLPDSSDIFNEWEGLVLQHQVLGKQAHDARLVAAMNVHKLTHLLTFNTTDFKRFTGITVISPTEVN